MEKNEYDKLISYVSGLPSAGNKTRPNMADLTRSTLCPFKDKSTLMAIGKEGIDNIILFLNGVDEIADTPSLTLHIAAKIDLLETIKSQIE